jgi:hypothetical protein
MPRRHRSVLLRTAPLLLAAVVGMIVIDGGFVYDDSSALLENPVVNGQVPFWEAFSRDFWGRPASLGFTTWRPLMPMLWAQLWSWWPDDPLPYRILSASLHVLAVAACVRFVYRLEPSEGWAAAVGTLFALHPLNTEAVSAIVAQADILSFALVLVACTIALGPRTLRAGFLCALVFLFAALVKESAVIFTPLAVLLFVLRPGAGRTRWLAALPVGVAGVAVIAFQLSLPRAVGISMITSNLAHHAEGTMRLLLGLHNLGHSIAMTAWPMPIAPNHGYAAVELHSGSLAPYAILGGLLLLLGLGAGAWAIKRGRLEWLAALSFLYAPALLQSHWFARLITDLAERLLYPSILGFSMLVSMALLRFVHKQAMQAAAVALLAFAFLLGSYSPRRAWTDDDALWAYAVRAEPRAALHQRNVSNTYFKAGDLDRGAYHRLIHTYLIDRFPEPVQWEVIDAIESLPLDERFVELPEALQPDDPCPLVRVFTSKAMQYRPLREYVVRRWRLRYPQCGSWDIG